jgi:hypothetical protein
LVLETKTGLSQHIAENSKNCEALVVSPRLISVKASSNGNFKAVNGKLMTLYFYQDLVRAAWS